MIKKLCYFLLLVLFIQPISAQIKTIENMVKFKIRNSGSFLDDNNDVDGYYFFLRS